MRYFDNHYLAQYLQQNRDLMVFVDSQYLTISDLSDLEDPVEGIGYDSQGRMNRFNYKNIEVVKSGPYYVDLKGLTNQLDNYEDPQAASSAEPESPDKGGKKGSKEPSKEEPPADDAEDPLAESTFDRRSFSLSEKKSYWDMIKGSPNESKESAGLCEVRQGPFKGLKGFAISHSPVHATIRATNQGEGWTWGSTITLLIEQVSFC